MYAKYHNRSLSIDEAHLPFRFVGFGQLMGVVLLSPWELAKPRMSRALLARRHGGGWLLLQANAR